MVQRRNRARETVSRQMQPSEAWTGKESRDVICKLIEVECECGELREAEIWTRTRQEIALEVENREIFKRVGKISESTDEVIL